MDYQRFITNLFHAKFLQMKFAVYCEFY